MFSIPRCCLNGQLRPTDATYGRDGGLRCNIAPQQVAAI
jgi:hypothetical protein